MSKIGTRVSPAQLVAAIATEAAALGWATETGIGWVGMEEDVCDAEEAGGHYDYVILRRTEGDVTAAVALNVRRKAGRGHYEYGSVYRNLVVEGHTFVNHRCFTRRGIDVSSVTLRSKDARGAEGHEYADVASMLEGEFERCRRAEEWRRSAVPVPGTPFQRPEAWFAEAAATLRAGRPVSLHPHGFGTGYTIARSKRFRYDQRGPAALEAKLGVGPVYVSTFDAD